MEKNYPDLTIAFVKIDIQGFDYFALLGMEKTLLRTQRVTIVGEYWPYGLQKAKVDAVDYYNELLRLGFQVQFIPPMPIYEVVEKQDDHDFYVNFIAEK